VYLDKGFNEKKGEKEGGAQGLPLEGCQVEFSEKRPVDSR